MKRRIKGPVAAIGKCIIQEGQTRERRKWRINGARSNHNIFCRDRNGKTMKFAHASRTRLPSTIPSTKNTSLKTQPSIKTTLPFPIPPFSQFGQNNTDFLEKYHIQLHDGTILPTAPPRQPLALRRIRILSSKPTVLPIFIHARSSLRPRHALASCVRIWRAGWQSRIWWPWRRRRVWCGIRGGTRCEWEDGRAGWFEDGMVGSFWDRGV